MKRRIVIATVLAGYLGLAQAQNNSMLPEHIQSATAISRVLGDGRKVATVVLEYDTPVSNKSLTSGSHLLFTHLTGGSHRATWFVAYGVKGVQDWLFSQHR